MRNRRVALYDDNPFVLELLSAFFRLRGYDVIACREPVTCVLYEEDAPQCENLSPCSDLMVADYQMPRMTGLEMLNLQAKRGCPLSLENKAIISGAIDSEALQGVGALGCAFFAKPFKLDAFAAWVEERERHMDLRRPLGVPRKERRTACCTWVVFRDEPASAAISAQVVNRSSSGLCLRTGSPLEVDQILTLQTELPVSSPKLVVRWTKLGGEGTYLAGASCC